MPRSSPASRRRGPPTSFAAPGSMSTAADFPLPMKTSSTTPTSSALRYTIPAARSWAMLRRSRTTAPRIFSSFACPAARRRRSCRLQRPWCPISTPPRVVSSPILPMDSLPTPRRRDRNEQAVRTFDVEQEAAPMLELILILLVIAAVAALLGFGRLSGAALTGAKFLIGVVLVLFLLVILGVVAIA